MGIKGYITKEDLSITGEIPKIRIPSSSIKASSDNHPIITTPLYITSTSHISSRLSASPIPVEDGTTVVIEEYYAGSALRRLTGYDSMYLIQNSGEQGIPMRIELENAIGDEKGSNEQIAPLGIADGFSPGGCFFTKLIHRTSSLLSCLRFKSCICAV